MHWHQAIDSITARLLRDFGLVPVMAIEIEFYLQSDNGAALPSALLEAVAAFYPIEEERGAGQYEIALPPSGDMAEMLAEAEALKEQVAALAMQHGAQALFLSKPFADKPGCGLHMHLHLENADKKNMFFKDDEQMSDALRHVIGGMLAAMPESMVHFAPTAESYARFVPGGNAPCTISWGANNRTVALRLPDKPHDNKHIEHRVAGAEAEIAAVTACMLAAAHYGLMQKCDCGEQIYGDASLSQYALPLLPTTLETAQQLARDSTILEKYFRI